MFAFAETVICLFQTFCAFSVRFFGPAMPRYRTERSSTHKFPSLATNLTRPFLTLKVSHTNSHTPKNIDIHIYACACMYIYIHIYCIQTSV